MVDNRSLGKYPFAFSTKLDAELKTRAEKTAKEQGLTTSSFIRHAVVRACDYYEKKGVSQ